MSPSQLLRHFARISEAPNAYDRLRRFILDLAVRGKLVEPNPQDEPARKLLESIQADITHRVESGELKNRQQLPPIEDEEVPFGFPDHWELVRLGLALNLVNGRAFKPMEWSKTGLPIIRIQNLNNQDAPFNYCEVTIPKKFHVRDGDLLISWSGTPGTSFGAHIWDRGPAILNQHIFRSELIGKAFFKPFLKLAINSRLLELIGQAQGGVGLQHITKRKLELLPLTVPPLAEQHRIVAKVNELMALCDRLEAAQAERESRRDRLVAASLHRLNQPSDADAPAFREHARFHLRHFPRLTNRPEHIQQLRQTIRCLAVQGRLVPQRMSEGPASDVLRRIKIEQEQLIRTKRLKRVERYGLSEEDTPFEIPSNWRWASLGELIVFGPQNGISPKLSSWKDAPKAITLTATTSGTFSAGHFKHVEAKIPDDSEFWLRDGDLLFQRGNTRDYVGIAAYYTGKSGEFLYPDLMMKVRVSQRISLRYVHLCALAPYARLYFAKHATGAQATMPKINQSILIRLPVPLPPLAEQHRIVAQVDRLMTLCDHLESQLVTYEAHRRHLLEAFLRKTLIQKAAGGYG